MNRTSRQFSLFVFVWLAALLVLVSRFPTACFDESEFVSHAYNLAFHHSNLSPLNDDVYPRLIYNLRTCTTSLIRPFFIHMVAAWIAALGFNFMKVRLFSVMIATLVLLLVYELGRRLASSKVGLWAALILSTRFFFLYAACAVRPDILLSLAAGVEFLLYFQWTKTGCLWWIAGVGLLSGLAPGLHTNGITFIIPWFCLLLLRRDWTALLLGTLTWSIGLSFFVLCVDWETFLPGLELLFFKDFQVPPILNHRWDVFLMGLNELRRFFDPWIFAGWRGGAVMHLLSTWQSQLSFAALAWGLTQRGPLRQLAIFVLSLLAGYALCVPAKVGNYQAVFEPWLAILLAAWLVSKNTVWTMDRLFAQATWVLLLFPLATSPLLMILIFYKLLPRRSFYWALALICIALMENPAYLWESLRVTGTLVREYWFLSVIGGVCWLSWAIARRGRFHPIRFELPVFAAEVLTVTTAGTVLFVASIALRPPTYSQVCHSLQEGIPRSAKVMGPRVLWMGFPDYTYRDTGVLAIYRWILNEKNLWTPLKAFQPDYLIIDDITAKRLRWVGQVTREVTPPTLLPWPYEVIRVTPGIPMESSAYALIRIHWPGLKGVIIRTLK